ncbi:peptide ABC transporter substrate-binding protein [Marinobacterium nitratireducens]|uniref:Peptide ABC transporter substrate-binding protein n=1 Tax=Marinobacterium nitratireducens TaxID=518897 RepID=A0A917Z7C0_9GAMM|nr:ABC transporter substrate-binding protein [Marinobacterium nitratireducens]GGO77088.1 peptide ABC transporter substrate-binding protein [Marinobacterium nitratireducens]
MKSIYNCSAAAMLLSMALYAPVSAAYNEAPALAEQVAAGTLPPLEQRLPQKPLQLDYEALGRKVGQYGGKLSMLMGKEKDTRRMTVYGYARLVGYSEQLELVPDILESVEVDHERVFTLHLREGHRWSDGEPFTSEDFRYWWEDVANNEQLYPVGPPALLKVNGRFPTVTFPDATTVRYEWQDPNPDFLASLAAAAPLYIYAPAHYMKQFHEKYADAGELAQRVEQQHKRDWSALHTSLGRLYRNDNPDLPVLQPWHQTTASPSSRYLFERNPYFHRVDPEGNQLPYIDSIVMGITESKLIPAKAATGETDLQAQYLRFSDYTLLKRNAPDYGFRVALWQIAKGAHQALFPNLNHEDPAWRELFRDVRFRRALSLAINRAEINRVIYYGMAVTGQNTLLPRSPLYKPEYRERWAEFDIDKANALLDDIGLTDRDNAGIRKLPDGRSLEIIVETFDGTSEQADVLQLIADSWRQIGVQLHIKPSNLDNVRRRVYAGEAQMTISSGLENGIATVANSPYELAPVKQEYYQWPKFGQYYETNGAAGSPIDMPEAKHLMELLGSWYGAESEQGRREAWQQMLDVHADNVFSIGILAGVMQPIAIDSQLQNVPDEGIWNWDPGAHFGLYSPDTFWLKPEP